MASGDHGDPPELRLTRRLRTGLGALALVASASVSAAPPPDPFAVQLTDPLDGTAARLDRAPAVLHLVFFATWCEPCMDELGPLAELEDRWRERGYRLVLVAVRHRQDAGRLRGLVEERRVPGRLVLDTLGELAKAFDVKRIPAHLLMDDEGRVLFRGEELDATLIEAAGAAAERSTR